MTPASEMGKMPSMVRPPGFLRGLGVVCSASVLLASGCGKSGNGTETPTAGTGGRGAGQPGSAGGGGQRTEGAGGSAAGTAGGGGGAAGSPSGGAGTLGSAGAVGFRGMAPAALPPAAAQGARARAAPRQPAAPLAGPPKPIPNRRRLHPTRTASQLWLRYPKVPLPARLAEYQAAFSHVVKAGSSATLQAAQSELVKGLGGLTGGTIPVVERADGRRRRGARNPDLLDDHQRPGARAAA